MFGQKCVRWNETDTNWSQIKQSILQWYSRHGLNCWLYKDGKKRMDLRSTSRKTCRYLIARVEELKIKSQVWMPFCSTAVGWLSQHIPGYYMEIFFWGGHYFDKFDSVLDILMDMQADLSFGNYRDTIESLGQSPSTQFESQQQRRNNWSFKSKWDMLGVHGSLKRPSAGFHVHVCDISADFKFWI